MATYQALLSLAAGTGMECMGALYPSGLMYQCYRNVGKTPCGSKVSVLSISRMLLWLRVTMKTILLATSHLSMTRCPLLPNYHPMHSGNT
jgi:uncharacterized membrane-anchored protein